MNTLQLPSVYQQEENVYFLGYQARVSGVHFRGLAVTYDLAVYFQKDGIDYERRAYNVDELMIERAAPAKQPIRVIGLSKEVVQAIRKSNPYQPLGDKSYHAMYNEVVDKMDDILNADPWIYIMDNCDGFGQFLKTQNIDYKGADHGTLVPAGIDLFKLGINFQIYKAANS